MNRPFVATVQIAGPFKISSSPLWIKARDGEPAVTGEQISTVSVGAGSGDSNAVVEYEEKQIGVSRGRRAVLVIGIVAAIAIMLIIGRKRTTA